MTAAASISAPANIELNDAVALVTGGGRGIGRAIVERLRHRVRAVVVFDLDTSELEEAANAERWRSELKTLKVNVTDSTEVGQAVEALTRELGGIDLLVNNVGGGGAPAVPLLELRDDWWEGSMRSNLSSAFWCTRAVAAGLVERQVPGAIVSIASMNGKTASPLLGAYSVAKAGVIRLTEAFALELAPHGIRVNCVCPGVVDTPLSQTILSKHPEVFESAFRYSASPKEPALDALQRQIPLGRMASPDDIAGIVAFLLSEDAAYITGQAVNVSGGMIAH